MRKIYLSFIVVLLSVNMLFAGGIVTNTNQSAAWIRWLVRDASTGIDAVYFNPAGLMKLDNGFHFSLNNQSIFQTQTITSKYPYLDNRPKMYNADVKALVFPDFFAVYKMDKFAFSFGVTPIGGGGSANFSKGVPTFEIPVAGLVPYIQSTLAPLDAAIALPPPAGLGVDPGFRNVTGYHLNSSFKGNSIYLGYQAGVSYAINDLISVSLGVRYVTVKNSYTGNLKDITIDAPAAYGGTQKPGDYLRVVAAQIQSLDPTTAAMLQAGAAQLDVATADAYVDADQTGSGITPIIGINISPSDKLNIGIKYEHHTKIEVTNKTKRDDTGLFADGAKSRSDMPSMLSVGVSYKPMSRLTVQAGYHYYLDKPAFYGKYETDSNGNPVMDTDGKSFKQVDNSAFIDKNFFEIGLGVEYMITDKLGVSAGYLLANTGVNDKYQSDISYSLSTNTVGGGLVYGITDNIQLNLGFDYVMYKNDNVAEGTAPLTFTNTYGKQTILTGVGLDISF